MEREETSIPGCYLVHPRVHEDFRGRFVKVFQASTYSDLKIEANMVEEYYSVSGANVVRGMHYQAPPFDQAKMVYCVRGRVIDVVVDLRSFSPSYKKVFSTYVTAHEAQIVWIPRGCAHGFLALENNATMVYRVSSEYSPDHDSGVRWDTIGFDWPVDTPVVSERDQRLISLDDFRSPF